MELGAPVQGGLAEIGAEPARAHPVIRPVSSAAPSGQPGERVPRSVPQNTLPVSPLRQTRDPACAILTADPTSRRIGGVVVVYHTGSPEMQFGIKRCTARCGRQAEAGRSGYRSR